MKILAVTRHFVPHYTGGVELYVSRWAEALARRGHELTVLTTRERWSQRGYTLSRRQHGPLSVLEVNHLKAPESFEESHSDPKMEAIFIRTLRELEPDIVHLHHLRLHSTRYPTIARRLGISCCLSLWDHWLLCARSGNMLHRDGERCDQPEPSKCGACMSGYAWGRSNADCWAMRGTRAVESVTGFSPKPLLVRGRSWLRSRHRELPTPLPTDAIRARDAACREALTTPSVVLCPTRALERRAREFVGGDLPSRLFVPGLTLHAHGPRPPRGERLRIGLFATHVDYKGVHVLLEALRLLPADSFEGVLVGSPATDPDYAARLRDLATARVEFRGRIADEDVPPFLASLDVLVAPSLCWEGRPVVIHEAFVAGVPVICSGIGGLAEVVDHDRSGWHFEAGNATELAALLLKLIEEPEELERLRAGIPKVESIEEDAEFHELLYDEILARDR